MSTSLSVGGNLTVFCEVTACFGYLSRCVKLGMVVTRTGEKPLKGGNIYFSSLFQTCQSKVSGVCGFGRNQQHIMVGEA